MMLVSVRKRQEYNDNIIHSSDRWIMCLTFCDTIVTSIQSHLINSLSLLSEFDTLRRNSLTIHLKCLTRFFTDTKQKWLSIDAFNHLSQIARCERNHLSLDQSILHPGHLSSVHKNCSQAFRGNRVSWIESVQDHRLISLANCVCASASSLTSFSPHCSTHARRHFAVTPVIPDKFGTTSSSHQLMNLWFGLTATELAFRGWKWTHFQEEQWILAAKMDSSTWAEDVDRCIYHLACCICSWRTTWGKQLFSTVRVTGILWEFAKKLAATNPTKQLLLDNCIMDPPFVVG